MSNISAEVIGVIAGACTALSLLPQLIKLIKEKKASDISVLYLLLLFAGLCLWIYYGVLREDLPIIITNIVSLIINVAVLILSLRYKKTQESRNRSYQF